ncbi:MAG: acyltransferase family protein [Microthrixaceae bacterium]
MRGFGVIGVMAGHALPFATLSFSAIVDVFFVISGFLITTLLLQEHRDTGGVDVRKFYARRLLRLLPALYVMLAGSVVVGVLVKLMGHNTPVQTLSALAKEVVASRSVRAQHRVPGQRRSVDRPPLDAVDRGAVLPRHRGRGAHLHRQGPNPDGHRAAGGAARRGAALPPVRRRRPPQGGRRCRVAPAPRLADGRHDRRHRLGAHPRPDVPERTKRTLGALGYVAIPVLFFSVWASTGLMRTLGWNHQYVPDDLRALLATPVTRPTDFYWFQWGNTAASWSMMTITLCAFRLPEWFPNRFLSIKACVWTGGLLSYSLYLWHVPIQELIAALLGLERDGLGGSVPRFVWVASPSRCRSSLRTRATSSSRHGR